MYRISWCFIQVSSVCVCVCVLSLLCLRRTLLYCWSGGLLHRQTNPLYINIDINNNNNLAQLSHIILLPDFFHWVIVPAHIVLKTLF